MTENLIKWQAARIVELEQQIAALESAAKAEPVAEVVGSSEICWVRVTSNGLKPGDKLYTAPAASLAQPLEAQADELSLRAQYEDACIQANKNAQDAERWRIVERTIPADDLHDIAVIVAHEAGAFVGNAFLRTPIDLIDAALSQKAGEQQ